MVIHEMQSDYSGDVLLLWERYTVYIQLSRLSKKIKYQRFYAQQYPLGKEFDITKNFKAIPVLHKYIIISW